MPNTAGSPLRATRFEAVNAPAGIPEDYRRRIEQLGRELGIPESYEATYRMKLWPEAERRVIGGHDPDGCEVWLAPEAADAWNRLQAAARADSCAICLYSGFRSVERQAALIRAKLAQGMELGRILKTVAAPGYSEHHTGRAVDVGSPGAPPLEEAFEGTPAFAWMQSNAARFGFHLSYPKTGTCGIGYEPWHWFLII